MLAFSVIMFKRNRALIHFSSGAGTILTVARSELSEEAKSEFNQLQLTYGVNIKCIQADVGTIHGIEILEQEIEKVDRLAGIVNSAVVLIDKLFQDVDRENYTKVMGPKVDGMFKQNYYAHRY